MPAPLSPPPVPRTKDVECGVGAGVDVADDAGALSADPPPATAAATAWGLYEICDLEKSFIDS